MLFQYAKIVLDDVDVCCGHGWPNMVVTWKLPQ